MTKPSSVAWSLNETFVEGDRIATVRGSTGTVVFSRGERGRLVGVKLDRITAPATYYYPKNELVLI